LTKRQHFAAYTAARPDCVHKLLVVSLMTGHVHCFDATKAFPLYTHLARRTFAWVTLKRAWVLTKWLPLFFAGPLALHACLLLSTNHSKKKLIILINVGKGRVLNDLYAAHEVVSLSDGLPAVGDVVAGQCAPMVPTRQHIVTRTPTSKLPLARTYNFTNLVFAFARALQEDGARGAHYLVEGQGGRRRGAVVSLPLLLFGEGRRGRDWVVAWQRAPMPTLRI
jgi:hypothetical protein